MPERYTLNTRDCWLLQAATVLLKMVAAAETLRPAELVSVAKLQHVLSVLPRVTPDLKVTVQVTGPRNRFGEIRTWHYWEVAVEGERLSISSGGHFFRPSTGGDSFTTMTWAAIPEEAPEMNDYQGSLWMVPGVLSFPDGVARIDFASGRYKIEVTDEDNQLLEDDEDTDEDTDRGESEATPEPDEEANDEEEEAADGDDEPAVQQTLFSPSSSIELYRRDEMIEVAQNDWHMALLIFQEMGWQPARPLEAHARPLTFIKQDEGEAMQRAGRSLLALIRNEPFVSTSVQMDLGLFYQLTEFVGGGAFIVGGPGSYEDAKANDF